MDSTAAVARVAVDKTRKSINDHIATAFSQIKAITALDIENGALKSEIEVLKKKLACKDKACNDLTAAITSIKQVRYLALISYGYSFVAGTHVGARRARPGALNLFQMQLNNLCQARLTLTLSIAETEGKISALTAAANDERLANSVNGLAQVLTHRVTVIEETLRGLLRNQQSILEHVRTQRASAPAIRPAQPDLRALFAALSGQQVEKFE